jgi:propanediol dehydratase small subunit
MDLDFVIEFNQAAFTHDITEADIRFALDTARFDGSIDEDESDNKHLVIGFSRKANPIEIMYNVIDENTINVFHAMKCRKSFLHFIKTRGEDNG